MPFDFDPYFKRYEQLVRQADSAFQRLKTDYPESVTCVAGCADCCHALFDLTLVEAVYISRHFREEIAEADGSRILEQADRADRETYRIKRRAFKAQQEGAATETVFDVVSKERVRCPLLDDENRCALYERRPLTCRFYGIPTAIDGKGHTCGLTRFEVGVAYPTVNLDRVQERLFQISGDMAADLQSRYAKLAEMLVPVSMALLTVYDDTYLGVPGAETRAEEKDDE